MTTEAFDPKASYAAIKAKEGMVAFAGFSLPLENYPLPREGFLKLSVDQQAYRGDVLTLTILVDTEDDRDLKNLVRERFEKITTDSIKSRLGPDLDELSRISLDHLGDIQNWYIEEIRLLFKSAGKPIKTVMERDVIPALEVLLRSTFQPVEWWPLVDAKANGPSADRASSRFDAFFSFFKDRFPPKSR